ncbi:MAG: hypothetical protein CTY21_12255 [Methylomonas sp.]|nr:MAG: hypothetical protein CTY21_12255 [Methylomonas sp.]
MNTQHRERISRQHLAWAVLASLIVVAIGIHGSIWGWEIFSIVAQQVPAIRLTGGIFMPLIWLLVTPLGVFGLLGGALALMNRQILTQRIREKISFNKVLPAMVVAGLLTIIAQPFATRLYMMHHGYHICQKLDGGLSIWHNDWVQNPEWCVRGKTHDWVRAMAAREAGADIDPDEVQRQIQHPESHSGNSTASYLWVLFGFLVGATLWGNEFRHWQSVRRKHFLLRGLIVALGSLVAGFFAGLITLIGYFTGEGRSWMAFLFLMFSVSWPLFGFLDHRGHKPAGNLRKVSQGDDKKETRATPPRPSTASVPPRATSASSQEAANWWPCLESPARKDSSYFLVVDSRWRDHPTDVTTLERAVLSEEDIGVAIDTYPWAGEVEAADVKGSCGALFFVRQFASGETAQYQLTPWTDDAVLLDLDISKNDNSWLRPFGHSRETQFGEVSIEAAKQRVKELFECSFEQAWNIQHPRP